MRVFNVQPAARPSEADRNGVPRNFAFGSNLLAPHAATTRWTYTVPANKKARCTWHACKLMRDAVAAGALIAQDEIDYTPSGGALTALSRAWNQTNTIGALDPGQFGQGPYFFAGDVVVASTQDQSTGGSCAHFAAAAFIEFDA